MPPTRKSAAVALGVTALVAASVAGASQRPAAVDTAGYCVDKVTNQRVEDAQCRTSTGPHPHAWYYVRTGGSYPRIGGPAVGGSWAPPSRSSYVEGGLTTTGGTVDASRVSGGTTHTVKTGGFGRSGAKAGS